MDVAEHDFEDVDALTHIGQCVACLDDPEQIQRELTPSIGLTG